MKSRMRALFAVFSLLSVASSRVFGADLFWTDFLAGSPNHSKINTANAFGFGEQTLVDATFSDRFRGIALDQPAGKLFVTNYGLGQIEEYNLDGSNQTIPVTGLNAPDGIAIDLVHQKLYWTDGLKIQRSNLDGGGIQTLFTATGTDVFSGIALDVANGQMYVADTGAHSINRFNLDGSGNTNLNVSGANAPFGIALDLTAGQMYWTDGLRIDRANLNGTSASAIVTDTGTDNFRFLALDTTAGLLYVANSGANQIERYNLDGSGHVHLVLNSPASPFGIAVVPEPAAGNFLLGDFNRDGHVNAADISVMINVLTDLHTYKTVLQYTDSQFLSIADVNGDGTFNNADLQSLLNYLKAGGGSVAAVPEPASFVPLIVGVFGLVVRSYKRAPAANPMSMPTRHRVDNKSPAAGQRTVGDTHCPDET